MFCNETCNSDNTFVEVSRHTLYTRAILSLHHHCLQSVERLQEAQELVEEQYNALDESIISNETIQVYVFLSQYFIIHIHKKRIVSYWEFIILLIYYVLLVLLCIKASINMWLFTVKYCEVTYYTKAIVTFKLLSEHVKDIDINSTCSTERN